MAQPQAPPLRTARPWRRPQLPPAAARPVQVSRFNCGMTGSIILQGVLEATAIILERRFLALHPAVCARHGSVIPRPAALKSRGASRRPLHAGRPRCGTAAVGAKRGRRNVVRGSPGPVPAAKDYYASRKRGHRPAFVQETLRWQHGRRGAPTPSIRLLKRIRKVRQGVMKS